MDTTDDTPKAVARQRRESKFFHEAHRTARELANIVCVFVKSIEDIRERQENMEAQLTALENVIDEIATEDSEILEAAVNAGERLLALTKEIGELKAGEPVSSEQVASITNKAEQALITLTEATDKLKTAASTEETKTSEPATANKPQYNFAGTPPVAEGSAYTPSGFQIAPSGEGASPTVLYFFSEDAEGSTNVEAKGANAEWVLYEGAYEAVPAPA